MRQESPHIDSLFKSRDFWFYYQFGSEYTPDQQSLEAYVIGDAKTKSIEICLAGPTPYSIEVSLGLDFWSVYLSLVHTQRGRSILGWWDEIRCHPYALRWEELERLVRYWREHSHVFPGGPEVALLLLARFVGNGIASNEDFESRKLRLREAYITLRIFTDEEIARLVDSSMFLPLEKDYGWTLDEKLGWSFGGEYPCYSLRNEAHAGSNEGSFPFDEFDSFMMAIHQTQAR